MVGALDSGSGGDPWPGSMCCVLCTLTVLLFTQVYKWVPANVQGVTLRWTSIPSRGSSNTPSCFMLRKPELSTGPMGQLGLYKGLPLTILTTSRNSSRFYSLCRLFHEVNLTI